MPSIIMVFATSKGIFLLIINVILMSIFISKSWFEQRENAKTQNFSSQRPPTVSHQINSAFLPD
jgi:hypothetical protein